MRRSGLTRGTHCACRALGVGRWRAGLTYVEVTLTDSARSASSRAVGSGVGAASDATCVEGMWSVFGIGKALGL